VTDRHREKPLSLRLGAERQRLEDFGRDTGQPVRRVIIDAVRAWLDTHACIQPCDPDCEVGPVHCYWIHEPNHKPGWHSRDVSSG
jgi:hypothetical protein